MKNCITIAFVYDMDKVKVDTFKMYEQLEDTFKAHLLENNEMPVRYERAGLPENVLGFIKLYLEEEIKECS